MTRWLDQETVNGQSQEVDQRWRYSEVQMELVDANRVAKMGQLSASIAHEVNQPIGATLNNASAALHWLSKEPADLEKAREALNQIFANGNRASEVIGRIRALFKKAPLRKEDVDINGAILEVIALTRGEVVENGFSVQLHLVACRSFKEIGSSCNK